MIQQRIPTPAQATVWLLQPAGKVRFGQRIEPEDGWRLTKKTIPVKVLAKVPSKCVPLVLAGIGSSQKHGRRTFTKIDHWEDMKAIDRTWQEFGKSKSRRWVPGGWEDDEHRVRLDRRLPRTISEVMEIFLN